MQLLPAPVIYITVLVYFHLMLELYLMYSWRNFRASADTLEPPVSSSFKRTIYRSLGNTAYDRTGWKETVSQGTGQSHSRPFSFRKFPEND